MKMETSLSTKKHLYQVPRETHLKHLTHYEVERKQETSLTENVKRNICLFR